MAEIGADTPVFTVGDRPVYPIYDASCGLQVHLPLGELPGAPELTTAEQPYLQLAELMAEQSCHFIEDFAKAVVVALDTTRLPLRDALAAYQVRAAEFDPCAVLDVLDGVVGWDSAAELPYLS